MYEAIVDAYTELNQKVITFNKVWPSLVVDGHVWTLPVLNEPRTPDVIEVEHLSGAEAVDLAVRAFATFRLDAGQAPGTVSRLPGYFRLRESVLNQVLDINACKHRVQEALEAERLEQGLAPMMRPTVLRRALGHDINTYQLLRTIHAFDGSPRRISFNWAGHTGGTERVTVARIREDLAEKAKRRADSQQIPLEKAREFIELRSISHLAENTVLVYHKTVSPHPRCTLWFKPRGERWDAMIKGNLPVFVVASDNALTVTPLKDFNRQARRARRNDEKIRQEALAGRNLYMPGKSQPQSREEKTPAVLSTYRLGGINYVLDT
ncbi:DNA replication terminus site-binding protein [Pseudomonas asuensis]|uniref:Replication terminus site-binding protein n=1 Tax=Pseudomonas asuensis TaxID=1825787 RepID=A0ABQ2H356_9PSED|nr:DNA replication terminus site-binding protein [Pseudomonas asuensis]GGM30985.1 hypothetical protein GCM10009425_47050 [Pseudomonas asuensis]